MTNSTSSTKQCVQILDLLPFPIKTSSPTSIEVLFWPTATSSNRANPNTQTIVVNDNDSNKQRRSNRLSVHFDLWTWRTRNTFQIKSTDWISEDLCKGLRQRSTQCTSLRRLYKENLRRRFTDERRDISWQEWCELHWKRDEHHGGTDRFLGDRFHGTLHSCRRSNNRKRQHCMSSWSSTSFMSNTWRIILFIVNILGYILLADDLKNVSYLIDYNNYAQK